MVIKAESKKTKAKSQGKRIKTILLSLREAQRVVERFSDDRVSYNEAILPSYMSAMTHPDCATLVGPLCASAQRGLEKGLYFNAFAL